MHSAVAVALAVKETPARAMVDLAGKLLRTPVAAAAPGTVGDCCAPATPPVDAGDGGTTVTGRLGWGLLLVSKPAALLAEATRHLFFTGKGGVGKTSLACAAAVALADRGRRVLLVSTDPASNLSDVLGTTVLQEPVAVRAPPV